MLSWNMAVKRMWSSYVVNELYQTVQAFTSVGFGAVEKISADKMHIIYLI